MNMWRSYVVLFVFVLFLLVAQPLFAGTYYVGSCKKGAFNTIGDAIAAAPAGSTINVCPGLYIEQLVISKAVNLHGICVGNSCQSTVATPSGGLLTTSSLRYGTVAAQIQVTSGPARAGRARLTTYKSPLDSAPRPRLGRQSPSGRRS